MTPSGSTTLPLVLDIFWPSGSRMRPGQVDRVERLALGQLEPEHHHPGDPEEDDVVAGLHHRRRVVGRVVGRVVRPAEGRERPQPRAEPGVEDVRVLLELGRRPAADGAGVRAGLASADTVTWPSGQYQAGIRWPHHSWRETFQSRMLVSQCSQVFSNRSGRIRVRPDRVASSARSASGPVRMNHWVLSRGSMMSLLRWQRPMTISCGCWPHEVAARLEVGHDRRAGLVTGRARRSASRFRRSSRRRPGSSAPGDRAAARSRGRRGRAPG